MEEIDGPPPISDISFFPHNPSKVMQQFGSGSHLADLVADRKPGILVARASNKRKAERTSKGVKWSGVIACMELEFVKQLKDKLEAERQKRRDSGNAQVWDSASNSSASSST